MPSITELYDAEKSGIAVDSPAAPTSDSITSLYDAEKAQNKERLKAVLRTASDVKPADAVMAGKLAVKRDLPPDVVLRNLQEIQRQTDADDGADKMKFAPMLAERMQDLNFAQKAREDLESLVGLEENIKKFGVVRATPKPKPTFLNVHQGLFKSVWRGLDSAKTGLAIEVDDLFSDGGFFGEEAQPYQFGAQRLGMWMEGRFNKQPSPGDEVRRADLVRKYLQAKGREEDDTPEFETETAGAIYGGASSTLRMAPALALSVAAKSPAPMLAVMGGQTQVEAYGKYAARGASGGEAFMAATAEGLIEVFTETIPMSTTLKALGLGPGGAVKQFAKAGVQDQVGEFFATLGQDAVDTAFANPDKTWEQYWAERPARAYQTFIATLTQSALVGGVGAGAKYISQRYRHEDAKATDAEEFAKLVEATNKHAEASQLNSMDATTFNQLMGEFAGETGEAPAEVYIDQGALVNSLNQSGMSITEFAALAPTVAEQLQREDLGVKVRVPVAEFLAVGPKVTESLVDSVRRAPDAMNRTEAKTWLESNGAPLRAEVEAEIQKQDDQETFRAGIASVRDAFKQELTRTKRFSASVNNAYADLMANYFGATASRLGMTPEALLDKYKLHVRSDVSNSARTMDQPAYHGGPHRGIDQFTTQKIGTGEGAQAYGWGMYFAQSKDIAEFYRKTTSTDAFRVADGELFKPSTLEHMNVKTIASRGDLAGAIAKADEIAASDSPVAALAKRDAAALRSIEARGGMKPNEGQLYEVEVPEDGDLLDYEARIKEQPEKVRSALAKLGFVAEKYYVDHDGGSASFDSLADARRHITKNNLVAKIKTAPNPMRGSDVYDALSGNVRSGAETASKKLLAAGIPGLRYLDANSRGAQSGEASRNYVIFDDSGVQKTREFYQSAQDQTQTEAFKKWFKGSKVVDADGKPLVVYHGSPDMRFLNDGGIFATMKERMLKFGATPESKRAANAERGFFFTSNRSVAKSYADPKRAFDYQNSEEGVIPAYVSIQNPMVVDGKGKHWREVQRGISKESFIAAAKKSGHDGVIIKNVRDSYASLDGGRDPASDVVVAFESNQIKHSERNRGTFDPNDPNILNQGGDANRAQIGFGDDITKQASVISLFAGADLSSFLHEGAHFFLEVHSDLAARIQQQIDSGASVSDQERGIVDDLRKLLDWFGVKGDENIDALNTWSMMRLEDKRQFHEQFARGFEAFAREGKAPTLALQSIFSRFGDWLKKIYASVKELNVSLNDDVRQVMGRMIATDRAIEEAIAARNMGPLFSSAVDGESVGMTLEQYNAIQGLNQEAKDAAIAALQARSLKDMKWLSRAHDKALQERQREVDSLRKAMRLEVAKEVMTEPVYQAWQFLTAKSDDAAEAGKLRTAELRETYGAAKDALWRPLSARKMTSDSGISPETLAERVGFDSGDALVKALVDATPPQQVIDARTDRRMLEEYGDINSPEALRRAADEAVHDEMRARVVAAEMKALEGGTKVNERRGTTSVDVLNEAAKSYAEELIGTMRLRDIRPAQYQAAAGRSGKLAETALKAGKTEEAMLHKRNQLVNTHAARAASDAKRAEEQGHAFLKRVQKPGRIPADNFDQIISLLERFDLRKAATAGELDSRARFSTWAKEQIERGEVPPNVELLLSKAGKAKYMAELQLRNEDEELVYADAEKELLLLAGLLESDSVRSYKELTSNEFNGLVDTVRQIDHTGRRIEGVLTAKDKRTFKAELERISSHVKTVAEQRGRVATDTESESTTTGKMKEVMRGAFFSQVKTHNMVHIIDGGPGGPLHERLVATAGDASNAEQIDVGAYHDKVRALLDTLPDKGDFSNKAIFYEEIGKSLNKSEFFSTLAEMGNASNRQRLMGGTGWSEAQLDALAARATAQEWHVIQGVWDIYESLRPRVAALERKLRGVEPDWVQARSLVVNTADGKRITLRGGYSPVIYDPRSHGKSMGHADEKQGMDMVRFARGAATVNRSFTKPRVEEVKGRPLLRSFDAKLNAIQDTLHYLHWQEWVMDASRFVKHLDPVIREHYGHEPMVMLKTWVADMAGGMQAPRNAAETWMTSVSRNVSWTTLAFNLASAAGQVSGYTQSMVVLGEGGSAVSGSVWMAKGLAHVIASPKQAYKAAIAKSDFLLKRTTTRLQALAEISAQVKGDGKKTQAFKKAGWAPMLAMQTAVDIPTWWAGYEKAMADPANNGDEARAVMLADQVVKDSQGSGLQMDLTAVERSTGALRLFTGFMMFMNTTMNLNYRVLRNDTSMGRKALDLVLLNIIPVMIGLSIRALLTPGDADKDEEQLAKRYAREQVAFILGQMVGFRELGGLVNAFANKPGGDYGGPVGLRGLADMYKLAKQIGQGEIDAQAVKSAVSVMGDLGVPIPSSAVNKAITGGEALVKDKTDNPAAVVFGFQKPH